MYAVVYGMRIVGIFPVKMDAINYRLESLEYDNRYQKHPEALDVVNMPLMRKIDNLTDYIESGDWK